MANGDRDRSGRMSEEGPDRFEIAQEMRSMAEARFDQVRKTFTKFRTCAQQTAGTIEKPANDGSRRRHPPSA
jgi:hypothetical protein